MAGVGGSGATGELGDVNWHVSGAVPTVVT